MKMKALHDINIGEAFYMKGETFECDPDDAQRLVDQELAEPIEDEEVEDDT